MKKGGRVHYTDGDEIICGNQPSTRIWPVPQTLWRLYRNWSTYRVCWPCHYYAEQKIKEEIG